MRIINVHNVNLALAEGLNMINHSGVPMESRNGRVLVIPEPVTTIYQNPQMRVVMSPLRDANPFFHVMEALWMLAGRNDVKFISDYNKNIAQYSDDGVTFHGAYGYRWRAHWGFDQLERIVDLLRKDRNTRRAVLCMWDPLDDWEQASNDLPCNDVVFFDTLGGVLNATVCCRSNDMWWGAHGANAVHFSFLLEYISAGAHIPMGFLRQVSNNYHLYPDVLPNKGVEIEDLADDAADSDPYTHGISGGRTYMRRQADPLPGLVPLIESFDSFDLDLTKFMADSLSTDMYEDNPFFHKVAGPMARAWAYYKAKEYGHAFDQIDQIVAGDWRRACNEWLQRRRENTRVARKQD